MFEKTLDFVISTGNLWAVLFTLSFIYTIINNTRRETERRNDLKQFRESQETKLTQIQQNTTLMLETWKLIIERELERREQK